LPDGDGTSVPVVETEAIDERDLGQVSQSTQAAAQTPGVQAFAEQGAGTDLVSTEAAVGEEMASATGAVSLDQMASELDGELLGAEGKSVADEATGGGTDLAGGVVPNSLEYGSENVVQMPKRARGARVLLPVAAVLLIALAGYLSYPYWRDLVEGPSPTVATAVDSTNQFPGNVQLPGETPAPDAGGNPVTPTEPASGSTENQPEREAFREKVLLAIQLGFGGDSGNE